MRSAVAFSTKQLEPEPGDMIRDRQLVYDKAEEMAAGTNRCQQGTFLPTLRRKCLKITRIYPQRLKKIYPQRLKKIPSAVEEDIPPAVEEDLPAVEEDLPARRSISSRVEEV